LSLMPGQAGMAPAADPVALALGVLVAFEAFQDVVAVAVTDFGRRSGRGDRAHAAAAEEHDRRLRIDLALQFGEEIRVADAARVLVPFDLDGIRDAAHPVPFGPGPDIDDLGTGGQAEHLRSLLRRQLALVR